MQQQPAQQPSWWNIWAQPQQPHEPDLAYWIRNQVMPATGRAILPAGSVFSPSPLARGLARRVAEPIHSGTSAALDTPAARGTAAREQLLNPGANYAEVLRAQTRAPPTAMPNLAAALPTSASPTNAVFSAMIQQESGGRHWRAPGQVLTSSAGALGIAQIMPGTGPEAARLAGLPWDPQRLRNDPQYNLQLGAAYFNHLLSRFGNVPQAVAAYNAGPARVERAVQQGGANWTAFLPRETQGYLSSVLGGGGPAGPPGMEAWNQYAGAASAQIGEAMRMALEPQSFQVDLPTPPELPAPEHFQAPDFSQGNEAFESARPKNPFAEPGSESRLLRENFFRGMAEAMLSLRPGQPTGFGELLLRAGAGALGGRMQGAEQVRQRMDRYDAQIAEYNRALASRNDSQAVAQANVINQNIELDNRHAYAQAERSLADHYRRNSYSIENGVLVHSRAGEGGQVNITTTPIRSIVAPQYAMQQAQLLLSGAGAAQQNAQWGYQMAQTMALQYAALGLGQGQNLTQEQEREALGVVYAQTLVPAVESGRWRAWMQPEVADTVTQRAFGELGINPQLFANDPAYRRQVEPRVNSWLSEYLVAQALTDPEWGQHILRTRGGVATRSVQRVRGERETRRVTRSRSGVSVSETTSSQYED